MKKYILFSLSFSDEESDEIIQPKDHFLQGTESLLRTPIKGTRLSETAWLLHRDSDHAFFAKLLYVAEKKNTPYEVRYLSDD